MAAGRKSIPEKELALRDSMWPDAEARLWHPKPHGGFISIPKTLPFLGRMMDEMSKNFPVSETYAALWCWTWDNNAFTRLNHMEDMAFAAGFTGQRGVRTFQDRLKRLEAMGFVELKAAGNSKMAFAYLPNPHVVIFRLYDALMSPATPPEMKEIVRGLQEGTFNAFLARAQELGSKDVLEILEARAARASADGA
jgi:hypothetical protein